MTMIRGYRIMTAPCCGGHYRFPNYLSMNCLASEYWTDGWRENSLMPIDEGLRHCACGQFVLTRDLVSVEVVEQSDLPFMGYLSDDDLSICISKATSQQMEIAARLRYWKYLNHPYRVRYRKHREAEEMEIRAKWERENPDRRSWLAKKFGRPHIEYRRPENSPFTFPEFTPSQEQELNMQRLIAIFAERGEAQNSPFALDLVELYRETGQFEEANKLLRGIDKENDEALHRLLDQMISSRVRAPIRYNY